MPKFSKSGEVSLIVKLLRTDPVFALYFDKGDPINPVTPVDPVDPVDPVEAFMSLYLGAFASSTDAEASTTDTIIAGHTFYNTQLATFEIYHDDQWNTFGSGSARSEYCTGHTWSFGANNTLISDPPYASIDLTKLFAVGRRLRINIGGIDKYGVIADSQYVQGAATTLTLTMDNSETIDARPNAVCLTSSNTAWVPVAVNPFGGSAINEIDSGVIDGTRYWVAAADSGKVGVSSDKGVTWTLIDIGETDDVKSVAYSTVTSSFFVITENLKIYRSTDGESFGLWVDESSLTHVAGSTLVKTRSWGSEGIIVFAFHGTATVYSVRYVADEAVPTAGVSVLTDGNTTSQLRCIEIDNDHSFPTLIANDDSAIVVTTDKGTSFGSEVSFDSEVRSFLAFNSPLVGKKMRAVGLVNGEIYLYPTDGTNAGSVNDRYSSAFMNGAVNSIAFSQSLNTLVAVGQFGQVFNCIVNADQGISVAFNLSQNGFSPTDEVKCVHRDDIDGVFIAGSASGVICRSSNGID